MTISNKFIIFLITLFITFFLHIFINISIINAYDKSDIEKIFSFQKTCKQTNLEIQKTLFGNLEIRVLQNEENTAQHNNFKWSYNFHTLTTKYIKNYLKYIIFTVKETQIFSSYSYKGFVLWCFEDDELDGKFNRYTRDYFICKRNGNFIMPQYPKGFVNQKWFRPDRKEVQERFDQEVNFWFKFFEKNK